MSRLEKKCFVASAGLHSLFLLFLCLTPLLQVHSPIVPNFQPIDFIPERLVDGATSGGGGSPAAPATKAPPSPAPAPAPPKVEAALPKPEMRMEKLDAETVAKAPKKVADPIPTKKIEVAKQEDLAEIGTVKSNRKKIQLDFTKETRDTSKKAKEAEEAAAAAEAQAAAQASRDAQKRYASRVSSLVGNLNRSVSSGTSIDMPASAGPGGPGGGGPLSANYKDFVLSVYNRNWSPPADLADELASVKVTVVIHRSGRVESFKVVKPSSNAALDRSVERLQLIPFIAAFPEGAKEERRIYNITFNLKSKREFE